MGKQKFRKLEGWTRAIDLIEDVYRTTSRFPKEEMYSLTAQVRQASNSIALNIAEGSGAETDKGFSGFLTIAERSAYEVMCGVEVATRLQYIDGQDKEILLNKCD